MVKKRELKLGAYLVGSGMHVSSWRHHSAKPDASININHLIEQTKLAETGKFDFVFSADSLAINHESHSQILNRFDPLILSTALASATEKIGIAATASTTYSEPFVLARQFASIDQLSNGRAGWNVVTTADATGETALNFSRDHHYEHDHRYERAEEFVDVVKSLWDSWEDDAFTYDKKYGKFYDKSKVHETNFIGEYFQVKGPLNIARSKQGQPVVFQAGASKPGQALAARTSEVVFTSWDDIEQSKKHYKALKNQLNEYNRGKDELLIFHAVSPIVAETEAAAEEKYYELLALTDPYKSLEFVSGYMGNIDFSEYDLTTPAYQVNFPEVNSIQSNFKEMKEIIDKEPELTVGDLYGRFFGPAKKDAFIGTSTQIADEMEKWWREEATDGFMIQFPLASRDLADFVQLVVPILQERGIFREEYQGETLRDHLGLKKPVNKFTHQYTKV